MSDELPSDFPSDLRFTPGDVWATVNVLWQCETYRVPWMNHIKLALMFAESTDEFAETLKVLFGEVLKEQKALEGIDPDAPVKPSKPKKKKKKDSE